jgi:hypothetical protein
VFFSCNNKKDKKAISVEKVVVDINSAIKLPFDNFVDTTSIKFIPLETSQQALMGKVNQLVCVNEKLIFATREGVFTFDKNGKFISRFERRGKGPEEYLSIREIFVDKDGSIYILDESGKKIVQYMNDGTYIKTLVTGLLGNHFTKIDDDLWAISISSEKNRLTDDRINIYSESKNKIVSSKHYITDYETSWLNIMESSVFTGNSELCQYRYAGNDTIFSSNGKSFDPLYVLDFCEHKVPVDIRNSSYDNVAYFLKEIKAKKLIFSPFDFRLNDSYMCFGIILEDDWFQVIYNLESKKLLIINEITNLFSIDGVDSSLSYSFLPKACDSKYFYSIIDAYHFADLVDGKMTINDELKNKDIGDNPIIVKYEFNL